MISVKSITAPFTQKPKPGTFQSCFLYLWYEIQILSNEGEKHRRAKGWGLSSCCILPMSIWRICHPSSPFLSLFYHKNISPSPNVLGLVRQQDSPQREADQRRSLHSVLQSDFLKSTGCRSPVKAAPLHKNKHTARQSEGQQYNRSFLPVQTEPPTLNSSQRHECLLYRFHRSKPPKSKDRKEKETVGLQYNGRGVGRMER